MLTRRFGRTDLAMPVLSCGGMRYQFKWQDQPLDTIPSDNQENLQRTVARALELGICHIETARGYGSSERQLGVALKAFPRTSLILQTKVAPTRDPNEFERNFRDSLSRLDVDYVDLFAFHGINNAETLDWTIRPGGCFERAQALRREGLCRFVGFSSHGDLETLMRAIEFGEPEVGRGFDYVNLHWYYILQRNWPAVQAAAARDMGVFIISPSDKGGKLYAPPPKLRELCAPLSPMAFNDLFCLARKEVCTISVGAARPSDFDEHLKALALLDEPERWLTPIDARLRAEMEAATGYPSPEARCDTLPRYSDTPELYNLPVILWLRNLAVGWDMLDYGQMRFGLLEAGGRSHWFPGTGPAHFSEVPLERVQELLKGHSMADEMPELLVQAARLFGKRQVNG